MQYLSEEMQLFYIKNKQNAAGKRTPWVGSMSPDGPLLQRRHAPSVANGAIAEIHGPTSIAESDARDPMRTESWVRRR